MIQVNNTLVDEELLTQSFVCHLEKCKGACCIEGDAGAPLDKRELAMLEEIYSAVKPYMTTKGIEAVEEYGPWVRDSEGDFTTPCVDKNKECAYVMWDGDVSKCAIEQAYLDGKINWKKPVSCHLYPIRITEYPEFDVLHYDRWHICHSACSFGRELQIPVFRFLKDPLVRKYGQEWYDELENANAAYQQLNKS